MKVPLKFNPKELYRWIEKIALAVNQNSDGYSDNHGTLTLTASTTTTTVTDRRVSKDSGIYLSPTTANAATALATTYHSSSVAGTSFTLTHANTADVDKTFNYTLVG